MFVLVFAVVAAGCSRDAGTRPPDANLAADPDAARAPAHTGADASADAEPDAEPDASADADTGPDARYQRARVASGSSIGHTSVVYKLKLEGGLLAAWKPDTRRGKDRYRGEVAAYRLGRALGLRSVPRADLRGFTRAELRGVLSSEAVALLEAEALDGPRGIVPGALVPWIPGLTFPPLEAEPHAARWRRGLAGERADAAPESEEELALLADLSTVVAFDTITGNWDRWSGGNLGRDPVSGRLLFIDNDGAFFANPPPDGLARQRRLLAGTRRFSRVFVAGLRALDDTRLATVFGEDLDGRPLLGAKALAGVRARLGEVRRAIEANAPGGGASLP